jgi:hypothetical protein
MIIGTVAALADADDKTVRQPPRQHRAGRR